MTQRDQLDSVHKADRKSFRMAYALMVVGVAALVLNSVLKTQRDGSSSGTWPVIVGLVVILAGAVMFFMNRGIGGRHQAVAALRPESDVFEVWGAAGLKQALVAEGVADPKVRATQGTALTMTTTASGLELWRGGKAPEVLLALPWTSVAAIVEGHGVVANDGAKPAVVLVTVQGNELVVLPARKPTGSLMTARLEDVRVVIARLESLRAAA